MKSETLKQIKYTVIVEPLAGELACGDHYLVKELHDATLIAVIDGLGHGDQAELAAKTAIATINANAHEPLNVLLRHCNESLLDTRGSAITLVRISQKQVITYQAIGNVSGVYWHLNEREKFQAHSFLLQNGIVGNRLPSLLPIKGISLASGDKLILATDGIKKEFENIPPNWSSIDQVAHDIFTTYRDKKDDGLVLVAQLL